MRYNIIFRLMLLGLTGIFLFSCNNQSTTQETSSTDQAAIETEWDKLKEDYHMVMAETFHPAEEGDLEPINTKYQELAKKAQIWAQAALPAKYDTTNLAENLQILAKASKDIGYVIEAESSDEEITAALFKLHDQFHLIQGKCDH